MIHTIVYISSYTGTAESIDENLRNICTIAKSFNILHNITGVIFYHNQNFLQLIEGEKADVELLMKKISADTRHTNITTIVNKEVGSRGFGKWNMDAFNLDKNHTIDVDLVTKCTDLFNSKTDIDATRMIKGVKHVLHIGQLKQLKISVPPFPFRPV